MSTTNIDWRATLAEALNAPGSLGNTYTRFYNYSFLNQIRLLMQGVAEPVATYSRWIELGRQVRKGSKAKIVLAPVMVGRELKDANGNVVFGDDGKPRKRQVLVGFRDSRTVFGFSDTDGDELPAVELPGWDTETALDVLGIGRVAFDMVNGNVQGFSFEDDNGRHVAINPAAAYPAKALLHEVAHLTLGHCKDGDHTHRGVAEFEAEATAYLVAKELELIEWDAAESRAYIQGWLGGTEVTEDSITRVFAAINKILTAGRVEQSREELRWFGLEAVA
jgi:antirestriction protein ArdC